MYILTLIELLRLDLLKKTGAPGFIRVPYDSRQAIHQDSMPAELFRNLPGLQHSHTTTQCQQPARMGVGSSPLPSSGACPGPFTQASVWALPAPCSPRPSAPACPLTTASKLHSRLTGQLFTADLLRQPRLPASRPRALNRSGLGYRQFRDSSSDHPVPEKF